MSLRGIAKSGSPRDTVYSRGKGVCKHKTTDCRLRQSVGQKRSIRRISRKGHRIIKPTQDTFVLAWRKRRKQAKDKQTNAMRLFGQKHSLRLFLHASTKVSCVGFMIWFPSGGLPQHRKAVLRNDTVLRTEWNKSLFASLDVIEERSLCYSVQRTYVILRSKAT